MLVLHVRISFSWVRQDVITRSLASCRASLEFPILAEEKTHSTTDAYMPTYETLQGLILRNSTLHVGYAVKFQLPWSPQQNSHWLKQSQDFLSVPKRAAVLRTASCMHCKERVSPTLQLALTLLVIVFTCGSFSFACYTDQEATSTLVLFYLFHAITRHT